MNKTFFVSLILILASVPGTDAFGQLGLFTIGDGRTTSSYYGGWVFPTNDQNFGHWYPSSTLDIGEAVGVSTGRRINSRWRTEIDFTCRRNSPEEFSYLIYPLMYDSSSLFYLSPELEGELNTYSGMFNVSYDFDREPNRVLVPYVGVGIGVVYFDTDLAWDGNGSTVSNETAFGFQAIAGVSAKLFRRLEFFTEYRFFSTTEVDFEFPDQVTSYFTFPGFESEYQLFTSNLFMGFRLTY